MAGPGTKRYTRLSQDDPWLPEAREAGPQHVATEASHRQEDPLAVIPEAHPQRPGSATRTRHCQVERTLRERALIAHREEIDLAEPPTWAVMKGDWTLIREAERSELYDTRTDPGQLRDLAAERILGDGQGAPVE